MTPEVIDRGAPQDLSPRGGCGMRHYFGIMVPGEATCWYFGTRDALRAADGLTSDDALIADARSHCQEFLAKSGASLTLCLGSSEGEAVVAYHYWPGRREGTTAEHQVQFFHAMVVDDASRIPACVLSAIRQFSPRARRAFDRLIDGAAGGGVEPPSLLLGITHAFEEAHGRRPQSTLESRASIGRVDHDCLGGRSAAWLRLALQQHSQPGSWWVFDDVLQDGGVGSLVRPLVPGQCLASELLLSSARSLSAPDAAARDSGHAGLGSASVASDEENADLDPARVVASAGGSNRPRSASRPVILALASIATGIVGWKLAEHRAGLLRSATVTATVALPSQDGHGAPPLFGRADGSPGPGVTSDAGRLVRGGPSTGPSASSVRSLQEELEPYIDDCCQVTSRRGPVSVDVTFRGSDGCAVAVRTLPPFDVVGACVRSVFRSPPRCLPPFQGAREQIRFRYVLRWAGDRREPGRRR